MDYIIIFICCLLASTKVTFQSAFGKKNIKTSTDSIYFNFLVFVISSVIFSPGIIGCSPGVWVYAVGAAVFTVLYQFFYTGALSTGSVSLTVLIVNFAMVINVFVSYVFFNEPISLIKIIAIIHTIISFVLCTVFDGEKRITKKWILFVLLAMLSFSGGTFAQKIFGESLHKSETAAFVSCFYAIAAFISAVSYGIMKLKCGIKTYKVNFRCLKYAFGVGICLSLFQFVYTYALGAIDGTFFFPVYTGGTIVLSTLSGVLLFKDKLSSRQLVGIVIGVSSMILMNF